MFAAAATDFVCLSKASVVFILLVISVELSSVTAAKLSDDDGDDEIAAALCVGGGGGGCMGVSIKTKADAFMHGVIVVIMLNMNNKTATAHNLWYNPPLDDDIADVAFVQLIPLFRRLTPPPLLLLSRKNEHILCYFFHCFFFFNVMVVCLLIINTLLYRFIVRHSIHFALTH